jgi:predicted DNA-binding protein YlxM (UPF0122 family)
VKRELNFSKELVNSLPDKERTVIIYYYTLGLSIHAIAVEMGIGDSRVHQIKSKALKRLELMSQRLYVVIEQNEWPDGFYVYTNSQRFGDLPTAMRYISEMRKIYIELANEQGRTITKDVWETDHYSCLCDNKGWTQKLYVKEYKAGF